MSRRDRVGVIDRGRGEVRRRRQADHKAAAPAKFTFRGDCAAVRLGDPPGDRQA
jgi:hypothetical protein